MREAKPTPKQPNLNKLGDAGALKSSGCPTQAEPIFESRAVYTRSHEWIHLDGKIGTVGITEFAKNELGDIVHIELPTVGRSIKAGEEACVLESTKSATDVYTPVSGKITAVNPSLKSSPDRINQSPEKEGWLYQIELSQTKELDHLLSKAEYEQLIHNG